MLYINHDHRASAKTNMYLLASNTTADGVGCNTTVYGIPVSSESVSICVYLYVRIFLTYLNIGLAILHLLVILAGVSCHYENSSDYITHDLRRHATRFAIFLTLAGCVELGVLYGALFLLCACWGCFARHIRCCRRTDRVLDDFETRRLESETAVCVEEGGGGNRVDDFVLDIWLDDDSLCADEWVGRMVDDIVRDIIEAFDDGDECPICLERLGSHPCTTPCGHKFHSACIGAWFATTKSERACPLCKRRCAVCVY